MGEGIHSSGVIRKALASPAFRRAFSFAMLLHVLALGLGVFFVKYWPVYPGMPVPPGLVLDVAEPRASGNIPEKFSGLERALAVMPPEAREMPVSELPEIFPAMLPAPAVIPPERAAIGAPLVPVAGWMAGGDLKADGTAKGPGPVAEVSVATPETPARGGAGKAGCPMALSEIRPHYPYGARVRGEAGGVTVSVRVDDKGAVESLEIKESSGHAALDNSAVAATKKARFRPAEDQGRPVPSVMNLKFEFRLEAR